MQTVPYWKQMAAEHRKWLQPFNAQYLKNWENLLNNSEEAAMCEAAVRQRLEECGVKVEPNEQLTGKLGGPDFRCTTQGGHFYVEATCVRIPTVEAKTGIENVPRREAAPFDVMGMNHAIDAECAEKAPQCANLDGPALVAIGTFHPTAAMVGFKKVLLNLLATGQSQMSWKIDTGSGMQIGDVDHTTELKGSAFIRLDQAGEVTFARSSISGLLLCGFGTLPGQCLGILHPNPVRPFDPSLLPSVEFGITEIDTTYKTVAMHWPKGIGSES